MLTLPVTSVTIDGEGVAVDDRGVTNFERLRSALARNGSRSVFLYAFDLLALDDEDLRRHPWGARRATLAGLLRSRPGYPPFRAPRRREHDGCPEGSHTHQHALTRPGLLGPDE